MAKKLIQIDVSSDTVCPWCFVGNIHLKKAIDMTKDIFDFEVRWHPFFLERSPPKHGINKMEFYKKKYGDEQFELMAARMTDVFRSLGYEYDTSGLVGSTLDNHRLVTFAAHQGYDKQNALMDELFFNYHCQGKHIGDQQVLLDAARKVGIEGAEELLDNPKKGLIEVNEEFEKYSSHISGVPHFVINGKYKLSGGQPPDVFKRTFLAAANDSTLSK